MPLRLVRRLRVADLTIALRADDPGPAQDLLARLSRLAPGKPGETTLRYDLQLRPARKRVIRDGRSLYAHKDPLDVVDALELDLLLSLARQAGPTPLHAATLACDGRALLLVGPSGGGKSTLARELLERGLGYMGDEHAFLDDALRASGLPRAIARAGDQGPALLPRPEQVAHEPLPVAAVVHLLLPRRPEAELERLAPAEAVARLAAAIYRRPRPEDLLRTARLAGAVPSFGLACEGAAAAAALVLSSAASPAASRSAPGTRPGAGA